MIIESATIAVNPVGTPANLVLDREAVWNSLVTKARNATPFVDEISACEVVEEEENGFVREAVIRGEMMRERIYLTAPDKVVFERLNGPMSGTIDNVIGEDERGLTLTISFALTHRAGDLAEEKRVAANLKAGYVNTLKIILAHARKQPLEIAA